MAGSSNGNHETGTDQKEVLLSNDSGVESVGEQAVAQESNWMLGVKKSLKVFGFFAAAILIWLLLYHFEILDKSILDTGNFIVSILLFVIAMPCSLFFRMDTMMERFAADSSTEVALLAALPIVLLNFMLIGAYRGWSKSIKEKNRAKK